MLEQSTMDHKVILLTYLTQETYIIKHDQSLIISRLCISTLVIIDVCFWLDILVLSGLIISYSSFFSVNS